MNSFFVNNGPFELSFLLTKTLHTFKKEKYKNDQINNISNLIDARLGDISFFENVKYLDLLNTTQASYVFIKKNHLIFFKNKKAIPLISENPLIDFILVASLFYPDANYDENDIKIGENYSNFLKKNTIIDERVKVGDGFKIGANSTIKKNVIIGNNVKIGSNTVISNSIIEDNVVINDGSIIGKIGFGFKFINGKMIFIPHIGCVKLENSVYIGANCTIDRGSFSNTVIGSGSMLDNQVHVAHNCKIGKNCFIAGQVGIAGSSLIGNNCMIGGQAGISGHLKIGDNVYVGGGSGVLSDILDNRKIMGYPAISMKNFIKIKKKSND